jgi:hypothetical protein
VIGGLGNILFLQVPKEGHDYENKTFDQQYMGMEAAK